MTDLERLIAIEDLRYLKARYVRYADSKDWDALAGLFTPEGTFTPHGVDGEVLVKMSGRNEIARTIAGSVGAATAIHHLFSYEIDVVTPTTARSIWAMEDWIIRPDTEVLASNSDIKLAPFRTMHGSGHYHGAYEKVDGRWFIAELKLTRMKLDFTY